MVIGAPSEPLSTRSSAVILYSDWDSIQIRGGLTSPAVRWGRRWPEVSVVPDGGLADNAGMSATTLVILATGGTIAGTGQDATDTLVYRSAQLSVQDLVAAAPSLQRYQLRTEQVAQLDSKDMSHAVWRQLVQRVAHHLRDDQVSGVVITHGTDTLEETAYFLYRALGREARHKPVVLTAAMRPATAQEPDGPGNLTRAAALAATAAASGVRVVLGHDAFHPLAVRKVHGHRLTAFAAGDAPCAGHFEQGAWQLSPLWPVCDDEPLWSHLPDRPDAWPWVEILTNHAGADARAVQAWVASGVAGLVVAGTGNGTVHQEWVRALEQAEAQGVRVVRATRCLAGGVASEAGIDPRRNLTPAQWRVELLLDLITPYPTSGRPA